MNAVISHDRAVVERARKTAGNLAHALKTELLTKLRYARPDAADDPELDAHIGRLAAIVDYHLARSVAVSGVRPAARTPVDPVVSAAAEGLGRAFTHKGITVESSASTARTVRVERQDLEEILGNLVENACRHAKSRVTLTARAEPDHVILSVSDDGPGMTEDQCRDALRRGVRFDERGPGAGLGLAIVTDLAALYGGEFALGRSDLGGLAATIALPSIDQ